MNDFLSNNNIKILHLIKSLGRGGAETLLVETAKIHDRSQFELHVVFFLPWKNQLVEPLQQAGVTVLNIPAANNFQIIRKYKEVEQYIKLHQIDLVHSHLPWAGFLSRWIHHRTGIPVIYTEHNKQERYHFLTRLFNRLSFNFQSQTIAVSDDVKLSILKNIEVDIPVTTIANGVNTSIYFNDAEVGNSLRKSLGINEDAIVVGTLAVFRKQKCLLNWLDVFASLYAANNNLRGILVGDGPLREVLTAHRDSLGLADVVLMPGMQTNAADWYNVMDVFMITSEFEGLPLALLESMASEKPVVSTLAGGIGEVVRHGETGFLVPFGDWEGLEKYAHLLVNDRLLRETMGSKGRSRIIEGFSLSQMVSSLESIYAKHVVAKSH
jgi:glycosyltransferase involved in cell wall biosynthesis